VQLPIVWFSTAMSLVEETKLLPDERDSQTVCGNDWHEFAGTMPAADKFTPNSANCPATRAWPLIGLFAAVMAAWLASPSAALADSGLTTAPQHGGWSLPTKQVGLVGSVPSIHVRTLN
jgi:hypothetical protein